MNAAGEWNYILEECPDSGVILFAIDGTWGSTSCTLAYFKSHYLKAGYKFIAWASINLPEVSPHSASK